jgi:class 3 adenylate cyclase
MEKQKVSDKTKSFRIDFIQEVISMDDDKKTFTAKLIPDPRRYEWKDIDGKRYLYDKFDKAIFPENVFADFAKQLTGKPMYLQRQEIGDVEKYIQKRIPMIRERLKSDEEPFVFKDKSEDFLESLATNSLGFVIMCVDLAGSTKLSKTLDPQKYAKLISTTLYEMSEVVPKFHGHVLKYTGDGLIAYFPEPSFIIKNDLALDCSLTIKKLVYSGINQILEENGYPTINIRIGLDSGDACIIAIGSPSTKRHKDIIGSVVSLAAKIQSLGNPGDILLGDITERNLHTTWREGCEEIKLRDDWQYKGEDGKSYKVHRVSFGKSSDE